MVQKEGINNLLSNFQFIHFKGLIEEEEYFYWEKKVFLLNLALKKVKNSVTFDYLFFTDDINKKEIKIIESIKNLLNIKIIDINTIEDIEILQKYLSESKTIITSLNCELLNNEFIIYANKFGKGFHLLKSETAHCPLSLLLNGVMINPVESAILHSNYSLRKSIEIFIAQHKNNKTLIPRKCTNQASDIYFSKIDTHSSLELSQTFELNYVISKFENNYDFTFDYLIHTLCKLNLNELSIFLRDIKQNHLEYYSFFHDTITKNIQYVKFISKKKIYNFFYILGFLDFYDINFIQKSPEINELKLLDHSILNYIILGTQDSNSILLEFHKPQSEKSITTFSKLKDLVYLQLSCTASKGPDRETQLCCLSMYLNFWI